LQGDGPFTVFAPHEQAFEKLPKGTLETLLKPENKPALTAVLTYHVIPGKFPPPISSQQSRMAVARPPIRQSRASH